MAVLGQSGLPIAALTRLVTHVCPVSTRAGGCSLLGPLGVIQLTAGRVPALASR